MGHRAYSDEVTRSSTSARAAQVQDFPSTAGTVSSWFRKRYFYLAIIMSVGMSTVAAVLLLDLVFRQSGSNPWVEVAILTLFPFFYGFMYLLARVRDFYVRRGVLHLPIPIRRPAIGRTWEVPLSDVVKATRIAHEDGDTGVLLRLNDGAQARLWLSDMPSGGREFLELLLQKFGT